MNGVPEGSRTPDPRFRKPVLYPAELPGLNAKPCHLSGTSAPRASLEHLIRIALPIQEAGAAARSAPTGIGPPADMRSRQSHSERL